MSYNYQELIKKLRNKLIISQEELAKLLDISFASVNRYENGHNEPTIKVIRKLAPLFKEHGIGEIHPESPKY